MTAAPSDLARCPFDGAPLLLYLGERTVLQVCPRNCCREMRAVLPDSGPVTASRTGGGDPPP